MDPAVTLNTILDGLTDLYNKDPEADRDETVQALRDLAGWIEGGGFAPNPENYVSP